jgi:hypothetical protein
MAKEKKVEEDILWKMLSSELGIPEIRELQDYLVGESDHYEMGYGELTIEPYDGRGGHSAIFRVRHVRHGETMVSASALRSALHDLIHELRR